MEWGAKEEGKKVRGRIKERKGEEGKEGKGRGRRRKRVRERKGGMGKEGKERGHYKRKKKNENKVEKGREPDTLR